jgi:hypothetical protein
VCFASFRYKVGVDTQYCQVVVIRSELWIFQSASVLRSESLIADSRAARV